MVVTFTAPCPQCATDVVWTQTTTRDGWITDPMEARIACRCDTL